MKDQAEATANLVYEKIHVDGVIRSEAYVVRIIAAALAHAGSDNYAQLVACDDKWKKVLAERDAAIEDAFQRGWKAGNDAQESMESQIEQLKAERDDAYVRGLERAIEIMRVSATMNVSKYWLVAAIQAEIDKSKASE